jgi:UPF0755 protein
MRPEGSAGTRRPAPGAGGQRAAHRRRAKARRRKSQIAVAVAMTVLVGMLGGAGYLAFSAYREYAQRVADFPGPGSGSEVVHITPGASVREMGRILTRKGVVRTEDAFVAAARQEPLATSIQPGHYRLAKGMTAADALAALLDPAARILARVTVPEGMTVQETVARLAKQTPLPLQQFQAAVKDAAEMGLPAYARGRPEGFLFPATYDVEPNATAASVLGQMVDRFNRAAVEAGLESGAKRVRRDPYQVVVIASLIQAEARNTADFAKVARVIYNRLARNMLLRLDSTVHYAVGRTGTVTTTARERSVNSRYNTYRHLGLPPGPIDSPGQAALEAAMNPAPGNWLYFVTVNPSTGLTKFATTEQEHQRNRAEFQEWLRSHPN